MTAIRVLLADDHEFFRSGFRNALETQPDLECVGDVGDGQAAVTEIERLRPDVAVLDVRMPRMDGLTAAETVLSRGTETRIMLLTTYDDDSYIYRGLRAGTSGFCLKNMPVEELLNAIRVVARGDALIDPSVTRRLVTQFADGLAPAAVNKPPALDRLTTREREILLEVARGYSNAEIAKRLYVGEQTVKTHVSHLLTKLGLRDRVQAVIYAYENALL
ncbi:response regulator transcription factor [Micromonospora sp. NBC_01813]|uniref:response regulator transcription factor n=1 Tax=Micromonospora sp. NBC_01813 TaxID=2975988 RepID=UPI002DD7E618|nr:response regulator transcription factor [Micromonospora sp. NBC_01813]WSA07967.1 response regulator transcription factor [Micromonospora sp. NBC_01813]